MSGRGGVRGFGGCWGARFDRKRRLFPNMASNHTSERAGLNQKIAEWGARRAVKVSLPMCSRKLFLLGHGFLEHNSAVFVSVDGPPKRLAGNIPSQLRRTRLLARPSHSVW